MVSWIVWLIVAAVLGVAELLTTTLAFGLIAVAAVVAAVVGTFHLGLGFQLAAFVIAAGAEHSGRVRIGGEEWSSRAYDESLVIPVGTKVDVMQIDGAIALVYPRE